MRVALSLLAGSLLLTLAAACSTSAPTADDVGFTEEWPVAVPPGSFDRCPLAVIVQEDAFFSALVCLPDDPDPGSVAADYLDVLKRDRFVERQSGQFADEHQTFLDGHGIEIFYQLRFLDDFDGRRNELTVILIKSAN